jgi:transposase
MRGSQDSQDACFSYIALEDRVPQDHPLRPIRRMVDEALSDMGDTFETMYAACGRPSIPPEQQLRALLIQILYSIRSERLLMQELDYNLLFRWFVGLKIDDPVWHPTTFTKNRDRLLRHEVAEGFFAAIRKQAAAKRLLSRDHFTVDGSLVEACASLKSFRPKDQKDNEDDGPGGRNQPRDFHGEKRRNSTHESWTDPDARLARKGKGKEARLCYAGHLLTENRHGLIVDAELTRATGTAEREAALRMLSRLPGLDRKTVGADKGYDTTDFVECARALEVTPHVACRDGTRLDGRTHRHEGYTVSQRRRKMIEERFGWMKDVGLLRKLRHRGLAKVGWIWKFTAAACNLVLMRNLEPGVT